MPVADAIIDDILANRRSFLPGPACDRDDLLANLRKPIFVGDLAEEEAALLLSTLPAGASGLWLSPLDKGLSGSKVFQARFERDGRRSKPFVAKVGAASKIEREATAIVEVVAPTILGIGAPIYRRGDGLAVVVQDLAALTETSALESLRNRARRTDEGEALVGRLLRGRLGPWYQAATYADRRLGAVFAPYLRKGPGTSSGFPPQWDELFGWVEADTGCPWSSVEPAVEYASDARPQVPQSPVHGDLHTQNVLVDELGECWPIDFGWTTGESSPLVDVTMLECSLKFLAVPRGVELRPLLNVEQALAHGEALPSIDRMPYADEAMRVYRTVEAVREFAMADLAVPFDVYLMALLLMTYALATHPGLYTPYVMASLQTMATAVLEAS